MAASPPEYRRLPGSGLRRQGWFSAVAVRSTLWVARDHLLCVDSSGGYSEDYRRLYFADIQSISLRKTRRGAVHNAVLGTLAGLIALITAPTSDPVGWAFGFSFAGLFAALFLGNTILGPTVLCHVHTAVQCQELPSLGRLRRARRVLAELKSLIEAAQGVGMTAGSAAAAVPAAAGPAAGGDALAHPADAALRPAPPPPP